MLPKTQQTKMLFTCQRFGDLFLFGLVWQFRQNIIKVSCVLKGFFLLTSKLISELVMFSFYLWRLQAEKQTFCYNLDLTYYPLQRP